MEEAMETVITEAPSTHIRSEVIAAGAHTKIIRLTLPAGEELPVHPAKGRLSIAVLAGEGRIEVGDETFNAVPGLIAEVDAGELHAVIADQDLRVLVVQDVRDAAPAPRVIGARRNPALWS
jgi:quercetin dioxygenase-like cupin family protein